MLKLLTKIKIFKEKGQVVVEYLLLLAVMVSIIVSIFTQLQDRILGDKDNCQPESKSLACSFARILGGGDFKFYTLRR